MFALNWTLIHRIDEISPLHGWDSANLALASVRIIVSVTGHDETMPEHVARYFDMEAFARDLFVGDYYMADGGHVFASI